MGRSHDRTPASFAAYVEVDHPQGVAKFVSFAFPQWRIGLSPARLRRAGLCVAQFSRPSFAFSPRSEHVLT
jgi:hypothetical protein